MQKRGLLDLEIIELDDSCGEEAPARVAVIREAECIGCTKCIQACPVDAIVGAPKLMHTVITDECTGCDLCVPPCPVDCIDMPILQSALDSWKVPSPQVININEVTSEPPSKIKLEDAV